MEVLDRGAYSRVWAPGRCLLTRETLEKHLGRPVRFPGDIEKVMPAFQGRLRMTEDEIEWTETETLS